MSKNEPGLIQGNVQVLRNALFGKNKTPFPLVTLRNKIVYPSTRYVTNSLTLHCEFKNVSSILRRYVNTFTNGFVKKETEKIKIDKKELKSNKNYSVKRRRLSNK